MYTLNFIVTLKLIIYQKKIEIQFRKKIKIHHRYSKSLPDREKSSAKGRCAPLLPKLTTPRQNRHYQTPPQSTSLLSLSSTDEEDDDDDDDDDYNDDIESNRGNRVVDI